ncbi:MBOAT family O-acyltransferase [Allomuricauda sp. NBRC 101325]|uniref:MBOAT family O-acyltransferase n=1 Tax=Allomuricauda sp. NBRC 101325 TaxID=1113758 RepID=UPI0028BEB6E8|nr:MBOAT family O-acyltransferase [Muricauda sp. NBRC 101325]
MILISSYVFYGWWDYRFLALIFLSTLVDYFIGISIQKQSSSQKQKILLLTSVLFNLGVLGFFKYYNFFIESWIELFASFGYQIKSIWTLNIVLPVGISFYTFQTMSYTIDVYRKNLQPTKDFISFASFVSFFPQLVAGPIERATNLVPQILNKRKFNLEQSIDGTKLIIWGMFKKVVIADTLAPIVDDIFTNYATYDSSSLAIGAIYFAFQIYCDFSGYSDIAIGTSKLFGFELMSNFKFPYLSRNIGEFWRRWHISLSTWFRDYLYIPLGGSKHGKLLSIRNIFIIFLVSGFWHGANWTFIIWGLFHSILFLPSFIFKTNRKYTSSVVGEQNLLPSFRESSQVLTTFILVTIGWIFFRSDSISSSLGYLFKLLEFSNYSNSFVDFRFIYLIAAFALLEYKTRFDERRIHFFKVPIMNKFIWIGIACAVVLLFFKESPNNFIYFQF